MYSVFKGFERLNCAICLCLDLNDLINELLTTAQHVEEGSVQPYVTEENAVETEPFIPSSVQSYEAEELADIVDDNETVNSTSEYLCIDIC